MANSQTIRCIVKSDRMNPHKRIERVGGTNPNGTRWSQTQEQTVKEIDNGTWTYTVSVGGRTVRVVTAVSQYGNRYIKTEADGVQPDNLLSLPACP